MQITQTGKPRKTTGMYRDQIGDFALYYNPLGYGGVTLVDRESQPLLDACNGLTTVEDIAISLDRTTGDVLAEINQLAKSEVVEISDEYTRSIRSRKRRKPTLSCWLHLTNSCNLTCTYCYIHKSRGNMSSEIGRATVDAMVATCRRNKISKMNLKFAGGEPLLRFGLIRELVSYSRSVCSAHGIEVSFTVLTNAVLSTSEIADYMAANGMSVSVSLDGVGEANNASRRYKDGRGSFDGMVDGLNTLRSRGIKPFIMTTVSTKNYRDLPELTQFLMEEGFRFRFSLERDCDTGHPKLLDDLPPVVATLHQCYDYMERNLPRGDFFGMHRFGDVDFRRPSRRACGAGSSFFSIGHDGKIGLCGLGLAHPLSTVSEEGDLLDRVKQKSGSLADSVASDYPSCAECVWRKSCAGSCPLQTLATYGRHDTKSPYCGVYREILPRILRVKGLQMIRNASEAMLA